MVGTLKISLNTARLFNDGHLIKKEDGSYDWPEEKKLAFNLYKNGSADLSGQIDPGIMNFVSDEYSAYIDQVSWFGHMPMQPVRDLGWYTLGTATALIDFEPEKNMYSVRIFSSSEIDLKTIYVSLRSGLIRADKGKNWSLSQNRFVRFWQNLLHMF